jgi:hypothetical protein
MGALFTGNSLFIPLAAFFVLLLGATAVVYSALRGIFVAALYIYARSGTVPRAFSPDLIAHAFHPKGGNI